MKALSYIKMNALSYIKMLARVVSRLIALYLLIRQESLFKHPFACKIIGL